MSWRYTEPSWFDDVEMKLFRHATEGFPLLSLEYVSLVCFLMLASLSARSVPSLLLYVFLLVSPLHLPNMKRNALPFRMTYRNTVNVQYSVCDSVFS